MEGAWTLGMGEALPVVGASQNGTRECAWMSLSLWGVFWARPGSFQMKKIEPREMEEEIGTWGDRV